MVNLPQKKIITYIIILVILASVIFIAGRIDKAKKLELVTSSANTCEAELKAQADYLDQETYSRQFTFDKYPASSMPDLKPVDLDPNSSPYAAEFKTKLREALASEGVNFAGHYSLISVGMTGWGSNYFVIDRQNGQVYEFPYYGTFLEFQKDSNLIIMNSKESIQKLLKEQSEGNCYFLNQQKVSDLRPFYFKWEGNQLTFLGPKNIEPPVNSFWIDYLSGIPESTPSEVAYFIRKAREKVIGEIQRVPREGYSGFMLIDAFPGIVPEDFMGITTPYGDFRVENGKLQFIGNAPSNAASMTPDGMRILLQNISKRLALPASTIDQIDLILHKIS